MLQSKFQHKIDKCLNRNRDNSIRHEWVEYPMVFYHLSFLVCENSKRKKCGFENVMPYQQKEWSKNANKESDEKK